MNAGLFHPFCDRFWAHALSLSQFRFGVATIANEIVENVWNEPKSVVPLQCQKEQNPTTNENN